MRARRDEQDAPNGGKSWSTDQERRLKQLTASGKTDREIARAMGRTEMAIWLRRDKLGLSKPSKIWSDREKAILREEYSNGGPADIARCEKRLPGRNSNAIRLKAGRMGLSSPGGGSA